jgi:predicted PurR-regulated permease PerM
MTPQTTRSLALTVGLVGALYICWQMVQPFMNVLLWAMVLSVIFQPVHRRLRARIGSPSGTAALSTLLVVVTILAPVTLITVAVVAELGQVGGQLEAGDVQRSITGSPMGQTVLGLISPYVDVQQLQSPDALLARLRDWSGVLANRTVGVVGGVLAAVVQTVLVIFTLFYLFRDGHAIREAAFDILPLERNQARDVMRRTRDVITASVFGVVVISAIQGVLGGLVFWGLGLPSPLLWGVVMFFLSMIPMAGAFLVWAPAALFLAFSGAYGRALFLVVWGILVIGSIDNFLSPRLVGQRTRLHELLIFFSVLGGVQVFGVLGLVLGPVTVALTLAVLDVARQMNRPPAETLAEESVVERQADLRQAS